MLPEWHTVRRLLLVDAAVFPCPSVLQAVRAALPDAELSLLVVRSSHYTWLDASAATDRINNSHLNYARNCDRNAQPLDFSNYHNTELFIQQLRDRQLDAALIFTAPSHSPHALAYLCYLAGIPIRVGHSQEFGGGVLSHCVAPPVDPMAAIDYPLHLLQAIQLVPSTPPISRSQPIALQPLAPSF